MSDSTQLDYEISVADIFRTLWNRRGFIVVVSVLAAAIVAAYFGIRILATSPLATYFISLRNIENGRYPNGTTFSSQDLLMPQVLTELQNMLNLQNINEIRQAISVTSDSPISSAIALKYRQRLATAGLSQAEIDAANQSLEEELSAANGAYIRIDIDYSSLDLSSEVGKTIARELPEAWNKVFITQFRVFTDRRLADMSAVSKVSDLTVDGAFVSALLQLKIMKHGLNIIVEDNRFSLFKTPNGPTAGDLLNNIEDFEKTLFRPLLYASYTGDDFVAAGYRKGLEFESEEIQRRIEAVDRGIAKVQDIRPKSENNLYAGTGNQSERNVLQLGESALSPIVDLANRANFADFIQQMVNDRTKMEYELSALKAEMDMMTDRQTDPVKPEVLALATEQLQQIVTEYQNLVSLIEEQSVQSAGRFFEPYLGPYVPNLFFSIRYLLGIVLAGFVVFILACMLVLGQRAFTGLRK